jgi:peptidoglycan/LPS O-acetylase OafA/YrhL
MNLQCSSLACSDDRSFGLDVCRTLAILLVVCGHTLQHSNPHPFLAQYGMIGLFGVDLFFCLSGFLIGRILLAESADWPHDHEASLFRFWYRRWMRTLPLYVFYLIVSLKYDWRGETTLSAHLPYLFFSQNLAWPMPDFFHLSWSLAVEEWFYLTFPLVILLFVGLGVPARHAAKGAVGVFVLVPFLFRMYLPAHMVDLRSFDEGLRQVVVFRLDAITLGVLMACLYVWKRSIFDVLRKFWWVSALVVVGCIAYTKAGYRGADGNPLLAPVYFLVSAIGFSAMLPWFNSLRPTRFLVVNRFVKFTSLVSYSLYLGHIPGFMIAMWALHRFRVFDFIYPNPWLLYPIFVGAGFAVATLTYLLIEKPVLIFRDKGSSRALVVAPQADARRL